MPLLCCALLEFDRTRFGSLRDFGAAARHEYERRLSLLGAFARSLDDLLQSLLRAGGIRIHDIKCRVKDPDSYEKKAQKHQPGAPTTPKYRIPAREIEDQVGIRIICYLEADVRHVSDLILREFNEIGTEDKMSLLKSEGRVGYASLHHVITHRPSRLQHREHSQYADLKAEIQIRTVLQHAWAEIEHDVQYKATTNTPEEVKRSFILLAGLIELADREFARLMIVTQASSEEAAAAVGQRSPEALTVASISAIFAKMFDGTEDDVSAYEAIIRHLRALGLNDVLSVVNALSVGKLSGAYNILASSHVEGIVRFYCALVVAVGIERFGSSLNDYERSDESGWPALLSEISNAIAASGGDFSRA